MAGGRPMTQIKIDLAYPGATVEQVSEMLMTAAFREAVCDAQTHVVAREVTVNGSAVIVDQRQSADKIPGFAKKFVGDELQIVQSEEWTGTHGDISVVIPGKPGRIRGTADVRAVDDGVVETVVLDVEVNIVLVGGKIAKLIAEKLERTMQVENTVGVRWLAGERP